MRPLKPGHVEPAPVQRHGTSGAPGATLATFTSAGFVRRGLQEAGFTMRKTKGFGRKRDMLVGVMEQDLAIPAQAPVCPPRQHLA